jgi:glycosyltransferase involved in cell wall biosynthesis
MSRSQIALVSREIHPFGGGIGTYVASLARFLVSDADVTVFVSSLRREQMSTPHARERSLLGDRVQVVFVEEPTASDVGSYFGQMHCYSARVLEALRGVYGSHGPDLIEFQDYLGEAAVTLQARITRDRFLSDTPVIVRLSTTAEICALLDGHLDSSHAAQHVHSLERFSLRFADRLIYGGGDVYKLYERVYGRRRLARGELVRQPLGAGGPIPPAAGSSPPERGPLRALYIGRLERRKGVAQLVKALQAVSADVTLTLVGGDTETAPLGTSMRRLLEQMTEHEHRVKLIDHLNREDLAGLIDEHHIAVFPSLWECWPASALEVLARNRPILATPVGGLAEMAQPGRSGWLLDMNDDSYGLARALDELADNPAPARDMVESLGPRRVHEQLCDGDHVHNWYGQATVGKRFRRPQRAPRRVRPLVSAVVPYYSLPKYVEDAVVSLLRQTYPQIEVIVVDDGSFDLADRVIARLAARLPVRAIAQPNSGLGAARNVGVRVSRGRYIVPLDADNMLEATFIERSVEVLEADPEIGYVTCWSRYVDERGIPFGGPGGGFQPLSNFPQAVDAGNIAGDAAALIRRAVFDRGYWYSDELTSYEDWTFYRRLHHAGIIGHCIPERLMRYRVRRDSMIREVGFPELARLDTEIAAHLRSSEIQWTSRSA